jgi:hypothetical protein
MQVLYREKNHVIHSPDTIVFRNALGSLEHGKLTFYPIQKTYVIDTIATIDRNRIKDTRPNIIFFLSGFFLLSVSFVNTLSDFILLFRLLGLLFFLAVMFYKRERFVLTIIFIHRKSISFSVSKEQFYLSGSLLRAVNQYQNTQYRFSSINS